MDNNDIQHQAEKLASYIARGGCENDWFLSKDLTGTERAAIKRELPAAGLRNRGIEAIRAFAKKKPRNTFYIGDDGYVAVNGKKL